MVCEKYLNYSIVGLLVSGLISVCLSIHIKTSIFGTYKRFDGYLSTIIYIVLFYIFISVVRKVDMDLFFKAIIITGTVSAIYGISQYFYLDIFTYNTVFGHRPGGSFGHPGILSAYLIMVLPLVYYYAMKGEKWVYPVIIILIVALMLTKARSGFAGFIVSNICFFIFCFKRKIIWVGIGIFLILIIGLNVFIENSPVKRFTKEINTSGLTGTALSRYEMMCVGVEIIKDRPFTGIGQDTLGRVYMPFYLKKFDNKGGENQNRLHNEFFDVTVDTGFVGLAAWLFFLTCYFRLVWKNRRSMSVIAVSSGVIAYLVQNQFAFGHIPTLTTFWIMVGMTVVLCKEEYA